MRESGACGAFGAGEGECEHMEANCMETKSMDAGCIGPKCPSETGQAQVGAGLSSGDRGPCLVPVFLLSVSSHSAVPSIA